jgi:hypothetical protein
MDRLRVWVAVFLLSLGAGVAHADGTFIAAANRTDMVFDQARNVIYVANGDRVLRYDVANQRLLDPIVLGGQLKGLDISPDGHTLAVADAAGVAGPDGEVPEAWVHLVDLATRTDRKVTFPTSEWGEYGTYSVAFTHDGGLLTTSSFAGSGWVWMRRLDVHTLTWTLLVSVRQDTMLSASADGSAVAFAESNISDGRWGVYYPATGQVVQRQWYTDGTSWFNYEIAANADGSQFTIPTYGGTFVYDAQYQKAATIGEYAAGRPIGLAYDPVRPRAYFPWAGSSEVRVYDMQSMQPLGSYDFGDTFDIVGNSAYGQGRTRISPDGRWLMVTVSGGVRFLRQYDSITTEPVSATSGGERVWITLHSSIPDAHFDVETPPAHGRVTIDGNVAIYAPVADYHGEDSFVFRAHYGPLSATAVASITVDPVDGPYSPKVAFETLPALQAATPIPGSAHVPGDFNGDGTSDLLWFNPTTSQVGYWLMAARPGLRPPASITATHTYGVTPGYFVGAAGDLTGDGYADLVFTSASRDLWLWTNSRTGGWRSTRIGSYPDAWQLIGAGDIDGDGYDDLLWLDPSDCQFGYWLMKGGTRKASRTVPVTCGYYPLGIGYYTPGKRLSILWTSGINDLYVWDSAPPNFRSYNLTAALAGALGDEDIGHVWAIGGGTAGKGIGFERRDAGVAKGGIINRSFDLQGRETGHTASVLWTDPVDSGWASSAGYLVRSGTKGGAGLYAIDKVAHALGTGGLPTSDPTVSGPAPMPTYGLWAYPQGWYVVGAPANGAAPLPWK